MSPGIGTAECNMDRICDLARQLQQLWGLVCYTSPLWHQQPLKGTMMVRIPSPLMIGLPLPPSPSPLNLPSYSLYRSCPAPFKVAMETEKQSKRKHFATSRFAAHLWDVVQAKRFNFLCLVRYILGPWHGRWFIEYTFGFASSGRKLNISVLKFRASVQVLNLKITIGAAQEAWYICISIDQGVFPDLTWFMWLFIDRTSEILLSLSNSGCFSLSSLPLYPHKVVKRAFSVVDSTKVYRKDGKPEVTCVILCFSDGNLRSFLLGKFEFTQK